MTASEDRYSQAILEYRKLAGIQEQTAAKGQTTSGASPSTVASQAAKKTGQALLKSLPGVGLGVGAYDAYRRAKEGDYTGAALSAGAGLAGLIPGPGSALAWGLTGAQIARDLTRDDSSTPTPPTSSAPSVSPPVQKSAEVPARPLTPTTNQPANINQAGFDRARERMNADIARMKAQRDASPAWQSAPTVTNTDGSTTKSASWTTPPASDNARHTVYKAGDEQNYTVQNLPATIDPTKVGTVQNAQKVSTTTDSTSIAQPSTTIDSSKEKYSLTYQDPQETKDEIKDLQKLSGIDPGKEKYSLTYQEPTND